MMRQVRLLPAPWATTCAMAEDWWSQADPPGQRSSVHPLRLAFEVDVVDVRGPAESIDLVLDDLGFERFRIVGEVHRGHQGPSEAKKPRMRLTVNPAITTTTTMSSGIHARFNTLVMGPRLPLIYAGRGTAGACTGPSRSQPSLTIGLD